jgi:hypothetical protein
MPLVHIRAAQHDTSLVVDLDYIAVLDARISASAGFSHTGS